MATTEELYISLDPQEYKQGKTQILSTELDIITPIRHFRSIRKLAAQKAILKSRLHKLFESIAKSTEFIETHMPKPSIPKSLQNVIGQRAQKAAIPKENLSQTAKQAEREEQEPKMDAQDRRLDNELQEIQAKLRMLNR